MVTKIVERRHVKDFRQRKAEERFHAIFAQNSVGFALVNRGGYIVENNPALQRMLECRAEDLNGKKFYELAQPDQVDSVVASFSKMLAGPLHEAQTEVRFAKKGERIMWVRLTMSLLHECQDDAVCAAIILEDISERKHTEEALWQSEFKFRALFESNIAPLELWHVDGRVLDANDAYLALTNFTRDELLAGRVCWADLTAPEHRDIDRQMYDALTIRKQSFVIREKELLLRDNRRVPVVVSRSLLPGDDQRGFGCYIDITPQRLALVRSEQSKALIKTVFSSLTGCLAVIDGEGNVLTVNDAWVRFVQEGNDRRLLAASVGTNYLDMCRRAVNAGDQEAERAMVGVLYVLLGKRTEFSMEYKSDARWLEMTVRPLRRPEGGAVISHTDITERHYAQAEARDMRLELSHFARVAMMGELTASLAHELSQPLTAIYANAQTAQRVLSKPNPNLSDLREIMDDIVADEQRAAETIRRVRNLLKKSVPEYQVLDLNTIIVEVLGFINTEALTKNVTVAMRLAPGLPCVRGDRVQLQQVVLNLLLNALDAMKDVSASRRHLDIVSVLSDSKTLEVSVQDSGTGIAPTMLDKVFDPFFTAKRDGLGMGLAICRSIIEAHGGRIWAANGASGGAIFRFTLPIGEDTIRAN